jgi:hypothetical protein
MRSDLDRKLDTCLLNCQRRPQSREEDEVEQIIVSKQASFILRAATET